MQCKEEEPAHNVVDMLFDGFDSDDSSDDSDDDDFKHDFSVAEENASDEKAIAQRQLLKAAKMQKHKASKKKIMTKNGSE